MKRYNTILKTDDGTQYFKNAIYPDIIKSDTDIYINVREGTKRLDTLAYKYYGDVSLWWIIAQANSIHDSLFAPINMRLRIPTNVSSIMTEFNLLNS